MSTKKHDYIYVNAFNLIPGIGSQKLYLLAQYFDTFEHAWQTTATELEKSGISQNLSQKIIDARKNINPTEEFHKLQNADIHITTVQDKYFPKKLKNISSPPFLLYVRGNLEVLNKPSVAIVGSRKISDYGKHALTSIVPDIARAHITIISGLALGTDAQAHRETLDAGGTTVAVLAGGIDDATITPRSHFNLAKQILDTGGAIISEYPIGTQPTRGTFPTRNRIMAGLSDATIITEATQKSGTLITADHAYEFGRKLFALPGSIFANNSLGPNMLIRDKNAIPLLCSDDVLHLFVNVVTEQCSVTTKQTHTNKTQKIIFETIKKHPEGTQINILSKETKLDTSTISSELTMMEIDGIVKNIGNQTYIIV